MEKQTKYKLTHIALIIIGSIFILLGAFHTELWYDEGFTVSILNHSYSEIWRIGADDVHPVLYYFILKTVALIFGNKILAYRIVSAIPGIIMGILGYTHIRKDFGNKTGILFTLLTFFLPFMAMYSIEIRMYTWTMLFVTLASIYAYRIFKNSLGIKEWILFAVFSLASAYCHYYGLMFAVLINAVLLLYLIFKKSENKMSNLIKYAIVGIAQIGLYLPWMFVFFKQLNSVSNSYWIEFEFPATLLGPLGAQFNGNLDVVTTTIVTILMYTYLIYMIIESKKRKVKISPAIMAIGLHFSIYLIAVIVTIVKAPVLYYRYMLVTSGLIIFAFSYLMANQNKKILTEFVVVAILILSIYNNIKIIKENYNTLNKQEIKYLEENVKESDLILYENMFTGTVITAQTPNLNQALYRLDEKRETTFFEAFMPPLKMMFDKTELQNYSGKIFLIDDENSSFYKKLKQDFELEEIERKYFNIPYKQQKYEIIVVEK